jgi:hypothetical protein
VVVVVVGKGVMIGAGTKGRGRGVMIGLLYSVVEAVTVAPQGIPPTTVIVPLIVKG